MTFEPSKAALLNLNVQKSHPGVLLNSDSDSEGLGWDLRFGISNKLPGDADAVGPRTIFEYRGPKVHCD